MSIINILDVNRAVNREGVDNELRNILIEGFREDKEQPVIKLLPEQYFDVIVAFASQELDSSSDRDRYINYLVRHYPQAEAERLKEIINSAPKHGNPNKLEDEEWLRMCIGMSYELFDFIERAFVLSYIAEPDDYIEQYKTLIWSRIEEFPKFLRFSAALSMGTFIKERPNTPQGYETYLNFVEKHFDINKEDVITHVTEGLKVIEQISQTTSQQG